MKKSARYCGIALAILLGTTAKAADITVTDAKVEGGILLITGTTLLAGTKIRLDGKIDRKSSTTRTFSFKINFYLPSDCIVALQKINTNGTLGAPVNAVVANCSPGVTARKTSCKKAEDYTIHNDADVYWCVAACEPGEIGISGWRENDYLENGEINPTVEFPMWSFYWSTLQHFYKPDRYVVADVISADDLDPDKAKTVGIVCVPAP